MSTIPASALVSVNPNVLSAGGSSLVLNGLLLTTNTRVPVGQVLSFPNDGKSVAAFFGPSSQEASIAAIYFAGFNNSTQKPATILFAQYPEAAVAGYLRGGDISGLTLTQLQAITAGTLTISIAGTPHTSSSIDLSAATSFSNAATIIQAAFTTPPFAVTFDSVSSAFIFTTTATGIAETITFPTTSALATALLLTAATGAVLSQGADAAVPGAYMDGIVGITQNWATFMTLFDPDGGSGTAQKIAFAAWNNTKNKRYAYIAWDADITPTEGAAPASFGNIVTTNGVNFNGTAPIYDPENGNEIAAFVCGTAASIDFNAPNGRITFAFRGQDGLIAGVTDETTANNLIANGYNFYGAYATAAQQFIEFQPGSVSGSFEWLDSYINQIWFNGQLQSALMVLLQNTNSIPYDQAGYEMVHAACVDPINAALNAGVIRTGVTLSASQAAQINAAAGAQVASVVQNLGWYLQVGDASPLVRQARKSPPISLWYTDGQSVQQIVLSSVLVQ